LDNFESKLDTCVQSAYKLQPMKSTLLIASTALLALPAATFAVDYETQIKPILRTNCYECHGGPKAKRDIRMDIEDKFSAVIGAEGFIVPGKPEESRFVEVLKLAHEEEDRMPRPGPNKNQPLKSGEIALIEAWVKEGASFEKMEVAAPAAPDLKALHTWVSADGNTKIPAYFVRVEGSNVVLKSEAGAEKSFAAKMFNAESIELAKALAAAATKTE
jgi:hypothetical protein